MTGTNKEITLEDIKDGLNQIYDRLSEIELILNDPMHGLAMPEGMTMQAGTVLNFNYDETIIGITPELNPNTIDIANPGVKND